jgi:glutamate 5-kinase
MQSFLAKPSLITLKIGSALLIEGQNQPRLTWMRALTEDITQLRQQGHRVMIVSSGAVALGRNAIAPQGQKLDLPQKQAAAACGQPLLMAAWQAAMATQRLSVAQILLTQQDTENRRSYLNARNTLLTLLEAGIIPIINENDTIATQEIRYGDNDRLAARVAQMAGADLLILLSDVDGLYTANPQQHPDATHLAEIREITLEIEDMAGGVLAGGVGSGGMITKIEAAKMATRSGCTTLLTSGRELHPLQRLWSGGRHSCFHAHPVPLSARKQWISGGIQPAGTITIDAGAAQALMQGRSLLFAGVLHINGQFEKGDLLAIVNEAGTILAKGLSNFDSRDARPLTRKRSDEILQHYGENIATELVHRDNLVLV